MSYILIYCSFITNFIFIDYQAQLFDEKTTLLKFLTVDCLKMNYATLDKPNALTEFTGCKEKAESNITLT